MGKAKKLPRRDAAEWQAREDLACALRWAARLGLHEGVCNHFSVAVPGRDDRYLINPDGLHWTEIRASDLVLVDTEGRKIAGKHAIEATAFFIHGRIHRARATARAVLHTHMPYATALTSIEGGRLLPVSQNSLRFVGVTAYDEDAGGYRGLALDDEEGDRMAKALADKRILFLANHGIITAGEDVACAFDDLYYLERAAQAQVLAAPLGKLKLVGDNLARQVQAQIEEQRVVYAHKHFTALKRILDREEPDYKR